MSDVERPTQGSRVYWRVAGRSGSLFRQGGVVLRLHSDSVTVRNDDGVVQDVALHRLGDADV